MLFYFIFSHFHKQWHFVIFRILKYNSYSMFVCGRCRLHPLLWNYFEKLLFIIWLELSLKRKRRKNGLLQFHIMSFQELSSLGLWSKAGGISAVSSSACYFAIDLKWSLHWFSMSQVGSPLRCRGREMALPCCSSSQSMCRIPHVFPSPQSARKIN